jgi:PTS system nitrogen regulatory IIA component
MAHEDFDIDSLAKFLHLMPNQVQKMAERGKLPGRKISGQWKFSQAEVHHWLEERIGASDEEELAEVEDVLDRHGEAEAEAPVSVCELLSLESIAVPLNARTRGSVISEMVNLASLTGQLWDPGKMEQQVRERENLHPTALDNGVALLHSRRPLSNILGEPLLAIGRTYQGMPFGNARGSLTDIFFLICSVDDRGHLRLLARLSRMLADETTMDGIRDAESSGELLDWMRKREEELFD